jgi:hypothetical protein
MFMCLDSKREDKNVSGPNSTDSADRIVTVLGVQPAGALCRALMHLCLGNLKFIAQQIGDELCVSLSDSCLA